MRRPVFADPKNAFVFRRIFGSPARKHLTVAFLQDLFDLDASRHLVDVSLLPRSPRPTLRELERSLLAVECTDARGAAYLVEVQVLQVEGFDRRLVCDVDEHHVHEVSPRDASPNRGDVVGITIGDFELWPDDGERKIPMLSRWRMTEQHTGSHGLGQSRLVFLDLTKHDASRPPQTTFEKWAYFFRKADELTTVPEVLAEPPFIEALEAARIEAFTVAEWDAYILAGIAIQDQRGALAVAERRGEQRSEQRGLRYAVEILCRALRIDLTDARRHALETLDTPALRTLLATLEQHGRWT